jgi:HD-GYP domain-containing protein (c-di-GMP phosphodiesterase class II)
VDEALAFLRSEAGTAFDPQCVDALIQILGQNVTPLTSRLATTRLAPTG